MSRLVRCSIISTERWLLSRTFTQSPRCELSPASRKVDRRLVSKRCLSTISRGISSRATPERSVIESATFLTPKPSLVTPDSVISKLSSLKYALDPQKHVPVVLATPSFALWLEKHHPFFQAAITRLFKRETLDENVEIHSVEAIVDKLPSPTEHELRQASIEPDSGGFEHNGTEGLSLAIVDKRSISGRIAPPAAKKGESQSEPTLSVSIHNTQRDGRSVDAEVGIRIANTVFVSGRSYTMSTTRWQFDSVSGTLAIKDRHDLDTCKVQLTTNSSSIRPYVPLQSLIGPRKVVASMGNILKQLTAGDGSGKAIPASTELEKDLPAFIKEYHLEGQRLSIWAIVKSGELEVESAPDISSSKNDTIRDISASLKSGARLHRVLSGGGGWGKKMGLLSLDPEYSNDVEGSSLLSLHQLFDPEHVGRQNEEEDTMLDDFLAKFPSSTESIDGMLMSPLAEIVKPGDIVQFFVASLDANAQTFDGTQLEGVAEQQDSMSDEAHNGNKLIFGVNSTSDSISKSYGERTVTDENVCDGGIVVLPSQFGAFSEKAMTYSRLEDNNEGENKREESFEDDYQDPGTKIDVPGSRIVVSLS